MNHLYHNGGHLFKDDNTPIHRAQGVTEWFDEYENDMGPVLWPLLSSDLTEHLWEI